MSITAIALANDMKKLQELLETSDELTPEMIADTMVGVEMELADKLDAAYIHVRNLEGLAKTCDEEAKRLADRKRSFENRAKQLKQYVLDCLLTAGLDKLKTTTNTFTARKGVASVIVDNEGLLPDELVTVQTLVAPDKKAIKEAIESGVDVPGAHIEIGARSLQVR
ncbi:siphovirus Gp157 family protein [Brenneria tiliae]|uniref:siphovirus Gp157 family protein n=1 Tax=Brenneria tiliae TaxID=2914984 RepID=UPI002014E02C|nr:siphovirus Gp157 family protein [Brenneria tiliae]MCL2897102.1 siphovirus Gp157 family protein [Brenneria tiliae]MCL2904755.1 siphovirus Gp157 family protein [Brenneria tiliae]